MSENVKITVNLLQQPIAVALQSHQGQAEAVVQAQLDIELPLVGQKRKYEKQCPHCLKVFSRQKIKQHIQKQHLDKESNENQVNMTVSQPLRARIHDRKPLQDLSLHQEQFPPNQFKTPPKRNRSMFIMRLSPQRDDGYYKEGDESFTIDGILPDTAQKNMRHLFDLDPFECNIDPIKDHDFEDYIEQFGLFTVVEMELCDLLLKPQDYVQHQDITMPLEYKKGYGYVWKNNFIQDDYTKEYMQGHIAYFSHNLEANPDISETAKQAWQRIKDKDIAQDVAAFELLVQATDMDLYKQLLEHRPFIQGGVHMLDQALQRRHNEVMRSNKQKLSHPDYINPLLQPFIPEELDMDYCNEGMNAILECADLKIKYPDDNPGNEDFKWKLRVWLERIVVHLNRTEQDTSNLGIMLYLCDCAQNRQGLYKYNYYLKDIGYIGLGEIVNDFHYYIHLSPSYIYTNTIIVRHGMTMNGYILELLQRQHGVDKEFMVKFKKYHSLTMRGAGRMNTNQSFKPDPKTKMLKTLGHLDPYEPYSVIGFKQQVWYNFDTQCREFVNSVQVIEESPVKDESMLMQSPDDEGQIVTQSPDSVQSPPRKVYRGTMLINASDKQGSYKREPSQFTGTGPSVVSGSTALPSSCQQDPFGSLRHQTGFRSTQLQMQQPSIHDSIQVQPFNAFDEPDPVGPPIHEPIQVQPFNAFDRPDPVRLDDDQVYAQHQVSLVPEHPVVENDIELDEEMKEDGHQLKFLDLINVDDIDAYMDDEILDYYRNDDEAKFDMSFDIIDRMPFVDMFGKQQKQNQITEEQLLTAYGLTQPAIVTQPPIVNQPPIAIQPPMATQPSIVTDEPSKDQQEQLQEDPMHQEEEKVLINTYGPEHQEEEKVLINTYGPGLQEEEKVLINTYGPKHKEDDWMDCSYDDKVDLSQFGYITRKDTEDLLSKVRIGMEYQKKLAILYKYHYKVRSMYQGHTLLSTRVIHYRELLQEVHEKICRRYFHNTIRAGLTQSINAILDAENDNIAERLKKMGASSPQHIDIEQLVPWWNYEESTRALGVKTVPWHFAKTIGLLNSKSGKWRADSIKKLERGYDYFFTVVFDYFHVIDKLNELVKAMIVNQRSRKKKGLTKRALTMYLRYVFVKWIAETRIPLYEKTLKGNQLVSAYYRQITQEYVNDCILALQPHNNVFFGSVDNIIGHCINSDKFLEKMDIHYDWLSQIPRATYKRVKKLLNFDINRGTHKAFMIQFLGKDEVYHEFFEFPKHTFLQMIKDKYVDIFEDWPSAEKYFMDKANMTTKSRARALSAPPEKAEQQEDNLAQCDDSHPQLSDPSLRMPPPVGLPQRFNDLNRSVPCESDMVMNDTSTWVEDEDEPPLHMSIRPDKFVQDLIEPRTLWPASFPDPSGPSDSSSSSSSNNSIRDNRRSSSSSSSGYEPIYEGQLKLPRDIGVQPERNDFRALFHRAKGVEHHLGPLPTERTKYQPLEISPVKERVWEQHQKRVQLTDDELAHSQFPSFKHSIAMPKLSKKVFQRMIKKRYANLPDDDPLCHPETDDELRQWSMRAEGIFWERTKQIVLRNIERKGKDAPLVQLLKADYFKQVFKSYRSFNDHEVISRRRNGSQ